MSSPSNAGANTGTADNRRRSSGEKFSGLMNQKRNSVDANAAARKASFAEMKPEAGIIGKMWNNFTTGGTSTTTK